MDSMTSGYSVPCATGILDVRRILRRKEACHEDGFRYTDVGIVCTALFTKAWDAMQSACA